MGYNSNMELRDKVIIITGSSDGIGRQIALRLALHQPVLALVSRDEERLAEVKEEVEKVGAKKVQIYPCDIRDTKRLDETTRRIISDLGEVDVLINNAGIWHKRGSIEELGADLVDDVIQTNLIGAIHLTRLILPYLKKQPEAAIINVVSKSGLVAQEGQSVYSASKYGLRGFTDVLKEDLKDSNVKVAGVYQGGVNTRLFAKAGEEGVPTETFTDPADLADVIVFMLTRPPRIWLHDVEIGR